MQLGGVEGIAQALHTSLHNGLDPDSQDLDGVAAHAKGACWSALVQWRALPCQGGAMAIHLCPPL